MHDRSSIELFVVGAGPAYTDVAGATGAAYLLSLGEETLLLDLGQGSFPLLSRKTRPENLGAVVISHLHPDHFVDLVPLRHYLRHGLARPGRVRVLAPEGLAGRLDGLHAEDGFAAAALDIEGLRPGTLEVGGFAIQAALVTHTSESYAFRVTAVGSAGPGLVYSGDVGRSDDLRPLLRAGDVLLSEVSFGTGPVPAGALHLDAAAVAGIAAEQRVGRVLLTHLQMGFSPEATLAMVRAGYPGPVELVAPGYATTIG